MKKCKMCESNANIHNDPYFITELETGYVVLGWYQRFKGYTVFNCKRHASELHELPRDFKVRFLEEMSIVAEAVYNAVKPDKLNYELLGNGVSHMHWHIYPRTEGDIPQKAPVWVLPREELCDENTRPDDKERTELISLIKSEIEKILNAER